MKYIAIKRYKRAATPGPYGRRAVNIPYGAELEEHDGTLFWKNIAVCGDHAEVIREHFARNDDGRGQERGRLSQSIVRALKIRDGETPEEHNRRWDVCWNDALCMKYRKKAQADFFLWSIEFFQAPIADLEYIAALVGAEKGK